MRSLRSNYQLVAIACVSKCPSADLVSSRRWSEEGLRRHLPSSSRNLDSAMVATPRISGSDCIIFIPWISRRLIANQIPRVCFLFTPLVKLPTSFSREISTHPGSTQISRRLLKPILSRGSISSYRIRSCLPNFVLQEFCKVLWSKTPRCTNILRFYLHSSSILDYECTYD